MEERKRKGKLRNTYKNMKAKEDERIRVVRNWNGGLKRNALAGKANSNNHKAEEKAIDDLIKEEERREKRERMKKMAEYKARKLQEKKDRDNERARLIKEERRKMVQKRTEYGIQARKKRQEVMKVFEKIQRSGKVEINKDLEKQLGFSITAVQEEQGATKEK